MCPSDHTEPLMCVKNASDYCAAINVCKQPGLLYQLCLAPTMHSWPRTSEPHEMMKLIESTSRRLHFNLGEHMELSYPRRGDSMLLAHRGRGNEITFKLRSQEVGFNCVFLHFYRWHTAVVRMVMVRKAFGIKNKLKIFRNMCSTFELNLASKFLCIFIYFYMLCVYCIYTHIHVHMKKQPESRVQCSFPILLGIKKSAYLHSLFSASAASERAAAKIPFNVQRFSYIFTAEWGRKLHFGVKMLEADAQHVESVACLLSLRLNSESVKHFVWSRVTRSSLQSCRWTPQKKE